MSGFLFPPEYSVRFFECPLEGHIRIGREPDNEVFLADPRVSRRHALVEISSGGNHRLINQSQNGTEVNGRKISDVVLNDRDRIDIGRFSFEFRTEKPRQENKNQTLAFHKIELIGKNGRLKDSLQVCHRAAQTDFPILLQGETGVGKEMFAQYIHEVSPRFNQPFISFNCATFSTHLMESELFGSIRGAFTGASDNRKGLIELAGRGTLFLDEIGEMPLNLQAKLLRVLEEKKFRPLGSEKLVDAPVRFVAATNRDLKTEIERQNFRHDLFHRLGVFHVTLAPLRERPDDLPLLTQYFLNLNGLNPQVSEAVANKLQSYHWPGNVRELRNVVVRAGVLKCGDPIDPEDLIFDYRANEIAPTPAPIEAPAHLEPLPTATLRSHEKDLIWQTLEAQDWSRTKTANSLGISRSTLFLKMRAYGFLKDRRMP